jgi:hypothetical protein
VVPYATSGSSPAGTVADGEALLAESAHRLSVRVTIACRKGPQAPPHLPAARHLRLAANRFAEFKHLVTREALSSPYPEPREPASLSIKAWAK